MLLQLHLPSEVIPDFLNRHYQGQLYNGIMKDWAGGDTHIDIFRIGDFDLVSYDHHPAISLEVGIRMDIRKNDPAFLNVFKQISGIRQLDCSMRVLFVLARFWGADWDSQIEIRPVFHWIEKPRIGSLLSVQVGTWLEPTIRRELEQQAVEIAASIRHAIDLKTSLSDIWTSIHQPVLVNDKWKLWLSLFPGNVIERTGIIHATDGLRMWLTSPAEAMLTSGLQPAFQLPQLPESRDVDIPETGPSNLPFRFLIQRSSLESQVKMLRWKIFRIRHFHIDEDEEGWRLNAQVGIGGQAWGISRRIGMKLSLQAGQNHIHAKVSQAELPFPFSIRPEAWASRIQQQINTWLHQLIIQSEEELKMTLANMDLGNGWALHASDLKLEVDNITSEEGEILVNGQVRGLIRIVLSRLG